LFSPSQTHWLSGQGSGVARIFKVRKEVKGGHNSCDGQVSNVRPVDI
jgi:hypothetical protein